MPFRKPRPDLSVCGSVGGSTYRPSIDHEHMFAACCCVGGRDETHRPILGRISKRPWRPATPKAVFDSPAVKLETKDGKVSAVVCKNLQDGTYTRYTASNGVILASGDYSYNDEMLQKVCSWVYAHKDNYLFSHEGMDCKKPRKHWRRPEARNQRRRTP